MLPRALRNVLWGDRERWGLVVDPNDSCWLEWQDTYGEFYTANQRKGVGSSINDAGYSVMSSIDLSGKVVLEIGAGDIRHIEHWIDQPQKYLLADIDEHMLNRAEQRMAERKIAYSTALMERGEGLPFGDGSVDVIVSFYSLEHLYPLRPYLEEIHRVLKTGGTLIGAIPAEGGLAWGLGRFLTSRRWFKKHTMIDPDKIICWEHPNFADEIMDELDHLFTRERIRFWPFSWLPLIDCNLIIQYRYCK